MPERLALSPGFRLFLDEARQNCYGTNQARTERTHNGGKRINFEQHPYLYTDEYIGGEPYVGFEQVSHEGREGVRPIWGMAYRGQILDQSVLTPRHLESILGHVLTAEERHPVIPARGPAKWSDGDVEYSFGGTGTLEDFKAHERITRASRVVYVADFLGGLANRNALIEEGLPDWLERVEG